MATSHWFSRSVSCLAILRFLLFDRFCALNRHVRCRWIVRDPVVATMITGPRPRDGYGTTTQTVVFDRQYRIFFFFYGYVRTYMAYYLLLYCTRTLLCRIAMCRRNRSDVYHGRRERPGGEGVARDIARPRHQGRPKIYGSGPAFVRGGGGARPRYTRIPRPRYGCTRSSRRPLRSAHVYHRSGRSELGRNRDRVKSDDPDGDSSRRRPAPGDRCVFGFFPRRPAKWMCYSAKLSPCLFLRLSETFFFFLSVSLFYYRRSPSSERRRARRVSEKKVLYELCA